MTDDLRRFYVYAFLRNKSSSTGPKYSPYYIGKGQGARAYSRNRNGAPRPTDSNFIVFVQEGLTEEEAFSLEKYCIALYGRIDNGTGILRNLTDGGEGTSGWVVSEDVRLRMSEAQQGEKHYLFGKTHSQETKEKMSKSKQGEKHPLWGRTHTQESRNKMSQTKLKYLYELTDPNGDIYVTDNLKAFTRQHDLNQGNLVNVINGKKKSHKGWTGKIVEQLR